MTSTIIVVHNIMCHNLICRSASTLLRYRSAVKWDVIRRAILSSRAFHRLSIQSTLLKNGKTSTNGNEERSEPFLDISITQFPLLDGRVLTDRAEDAIGFCFWPWRLSNLMPVGAHLVILVAVVLVAAPGSSNPTLPSSPQYKDLGPFPPASLESQVGCHYLSTTGIFTSRINFADPPSFPQNNPHPDQALSTAPAGNQASANTHSIPQNCSQSTRYLVHKKCLLLISSVWVANLKEYNCAPDD